MRRALGIAVVALLLCTGTSAAAPPSPSVSYAYRLAEQNWGSPASCLPDLQVVGDREISGSMEVKPCSIYITRAFAAPIYFGNVCRMMFNALAYMHGVDYYAAAMPRTCRSHLLFLLNHPHYLRRFQ